MKYSFNNSDFRNLKGRIAEGLVKRYIKEITIPSLKKTWDEAVFTPIAWFGDEELQNRNRQPYEQIFWKHEEKFFIVNSYYPTPNLLTKFKLLTKTLENVPDGFLLKLKKTGETKTLKETLENLGVEDHWQDNGYAFFRDQHQDDELLAVVDGEIEIIEVKSDSSNLPPHQKQSYTAVLNAGFALRFFHIDLSNFTDNEFEVSEKLILNPVQLTSFPIK